MPSYQELTAQIVKLQAQAEQARLKEIAAVVAQIHDLVRQYNLSPEDLGLRAPRGRGRGRAAAPVSAKYRDPETGATWSGRGRAPAWIQGKDREKFAV